MWVRMPGRTAKLANGLCLCWRLPVQYGLVDYQFVCVSNKIIFVLITVKAKC